MVELMWDGKYDDNGKRVAPLKVALPFQTVETVNEDPIERKRQLDLFAAGRDSEWRNRLIWGDKKYVLPSLLPEFAGRVDLIYIDPPFATGQDFSFQAQVGDEQFSKEASVIEQKAYRDTWGRGIDSYLKWFYDTAVFLYQLLSDIGSIYVHCDWRVAAHVKTILDEVFGDLQFDNEIIWKSTNTHPNNKTYGSIHQNIFFYHKSQTYTFNTQYIDYDQEYIDNYYNRVDEITGKRFQSSDLVGHKGVNPVYEWRGISRPWRFPRHRLDELDAAGKIFWTKNNFPRLKRFLEDAKGLPAQSMWYDKAVRNIRSWDTESVGYQTQKPEALLERILRSSSNEGDLVLDCFCGSGTTAAVAEKLNRRWIACDLGRFAIHTTRKRLLGVENVRPFVVQNLGKYERQVWQKAEFGADAPSITRAYRRFILDLYHAEMVEGYNWLHGKKGRRMVHVGSVDSPVALGDVKQIAIDFRRAIGSGESAPGVNAVDVLGWDFALDMNETAQQIAQEAGINVCFVRIPQEVLERNAVVQGDIKFFQLAALDVDVNKRGREVSVALSDFTVPLYDVPDDVVKAVGDWSEWIDYWAVDFNYRDDTFHNQWQSYRTRKDRTLLLRVNHTYEAPGDYIVLVKVIDILGNDTTKTITVKVV